MVLINRHWRWPNPPPVQITNFSEAVFREGHRLFYGVCTTDIAISHNRFDHY